MFTKTIKALLPKKTKTWAKDVINNASGTAEIQQSISAVSNTILEKGFATAGAFLPTFRRFQR